ncbi:N,N-dimethylformamidase beta subunit family domain-containing protein [Chroococcidiopsis sp. TS-821]|uniref:N,N-dimethylformamidase beta subunit family domain-containing protein n=1 Tax=Chroococcidiopsis sp. TS-821 TaxID=1378066 RepID=UPI000CEE5670|nr:N,N-dimethylformamidase beta subunit family domain-containing protein [Chroococcidiopsis sp. TS-821]PPS42787.1 Ig domain-containing protein group 1 domain-containing protein [Chroococcidiopsis sp. TS-821]
MDNNSPTFLIAQAPNNQTIFTTQSPSIPNVSDGVPYELGMRFRSAKAGRIIAIRYWKAASEPGSHIGRIWSTNGTILASVTFTNETTSGWQQATLSTPLLIQANTTYVVTVNVNSYFAISYDQLANSIVNGDLSSVAGNNGVYGVPGALPQNSFRNSNYFRDIVFVANVPPTITIVSGNNQNGNAGAALPEPLVVQVKDTTGNPQAGVTVTFAVTAGGGSVSPTTAITNANGQASTTLTLGPAADTVNTVKATAPNIGEVTFSARSNATVSNPIVLENQKPGTTAWKITNQGTTEIVGYATATSVNRGQSLPIKVSLQQPGQFRVDVYRLGYYGGTGGRLMVSSGALNGTTQPAPTMTDSATRLVECDWSTSYTIPVGSDWTSGLYTAKLTHLGNGKQSQIWFVVRNDSSTSDILFQSSFTTYLAYNNYGGYSTYAYHSIGGQKAAKVSLDRPLSMTNIEWHHYNLMTLWERNMARWLESQGYDVSYVTNLDIQTNPSILQQHKVFLSVGHDEYWTMEQRNAVEQARNAGVNLAFFSANTAYWRVRFENSSSGVTNRVMVCYKDQWAQDPVAPTNKFRSPQNNKPENALLGVMYTGDRDDLYFTWGDINGTTNTYGGYDFIVTNSNNPYYANTGLQNGDRLTGLVGFEWDAIANNGATPNGLVILGQSQVNPANIDEDLPQGTNTQVSHAVRYTAASGAKVFSTGSNQWMWGLDSDRINPSKEDLRVKQIAVNIFADMGAKPLTPDPNIIVP